LILPSFIGPFLKDKKIKLEKKKRGGEKIKKKPKFQKKIGTGTTQRE